MSEQVIQQGRLRGTGVTGLALLTCDGPAVTPALIEEMKTEVDRQIRIAGAASLVVSLWAVNDPATAQLMTAFYKRFKTGVAPRQALRTAALNTRQLFPHPYCSASFFFVGRA